MVTINLSQGLNLYFNMRLCLYICVVYFLSNTPRGVTSSLRDKWLLSHVFLHQNLPLCSQVALTPGYLTPCHVRSAEDEAALPCLVDKNCGNYDISPCKTFCNDGSFDKTCMPHSVSPTSMMCACSTQKSADYHGDDMTWSGWWSSLASPYTGLYRDMCDKTSGECLAKEYRLEQTYLAKHLDLQPSAFSASSVFRPPRHDPFYEYQVRADIKYAICTWAAENYPPGWVQFDLGRPHTITGVLVSKRCDMITEYLVSFTLTGSNDGSVWTTPGDAIYVNYNDNLNGTHWFDAPLPSKSLWRITVETVNIGYASARADLIGYVTD